MRTGLKDHFLIQLKRLLLPPEPTKAGPSLAESVEEARKEWLLARRYFESVNEPELVDHAAYLIKATERRYMFLVRLARAEEAKLQQDDAVETSVAPTPTGEA